MAILRQPTPEDGPAVWRLVKGTGVLDLNSMYQYVMFFDRFSETCVLAEQEGKVVGFVTAFKAPKNPKTIFVWQVGVDASARGQGLASRLLDHLLQLPECRGKVRWMETTVTPSNQPSRALFHSLAKRHHARCEIVPGFDGSLLGEGHESEELYKIGPLTSFAGKS